MAATDKQFASRWGFIYAAVGSAVGLGNIWRFPFIAGENGGGAFVLLYIAFVIGLGVPALIAMIVIGRRGRQSPITSTALLAKAEGRSHHWKLVGGLTVLVAYTALALFSVIAGWTLAYLLKAISGQFSGIAPGAAQQLFGEFRSSPVQMAAWHGLFMVCTIMIVAQGVRAGIERALKFMMPALFVLLLVLCGYGIFAADFAGALRFMFAPDFSKIDSEAVLLAIGQAFVSLSVGGGGIIAYGAYMAKEASIPRAAAVIACADTVVAMLAGLAIFPIVLAYGLHANAGPELIFVTLPIAFGQMPAGYVFGGCFFVLVFFAAVSSSISMLEAVVSWLQERSRLPRGALAALAGGLAWLVGLSAVFSFNIWSDLKPLAMFALFRDATLFRILDFFLANVLVSVSAFMLAIFVTWVMSRAATCEELGIGDGFVFRAWYWIMRVVAPVAIAAIFISNF